MHAKVNYWYLHNGLQLIRETSEHRKKIRTKERKENLNYENEEKDYSTPSQPFFILFSN